MTLAERIFALRTKRELSQEELAEQLGVSRQSVSKWETGQSVPDLDKLIKLADLFGVTLDELARDTSEHGEGASAQEPERTPFWRRDLLSPWLEDLQHRIFVFIVLILATVLAVALKVPGALWLPVLAFEVVLVTETPASGGGRHPAHRPSAARASPSGGGAGGPVSCGRAVPGPARHRQKEIDHTKEGAAFAASFHFRPIPRPSAFTSLSGCDKITTDFKQRGTFSCPITFSP